VRSSLCKKISCYETQQPILGTGAAIWWVTEPHYGRRILLYTPKLMVPQHKLKQRKGLLLWSISIIWRQKRGGGELKKGI
jgi:hypothetical protein